MRVYIETYGCQMNEYDSGLMAAVLEQDGHEAADDPAHADVVIVNTCSVRERAERRVLGRLLHLRGLMRKDALLGVAGCVAQRRGDELLRAVRGLNFVVGTDQYARLPELVRGAGAGSRCVAVDSDHAESYEARPARKTASLSEFVGVMRGCDNYCSYCIVPYVRGRERSRGIEGVVGEVEELVALGTREVTLIGQNVNSFRDGDSGFPALLRAVAGVSGLLRVRFATSHPKDLSDELIETVASVDGVCEHIHLPVQSGSDSVLAAMNRSYTREHYTELVRRIRDRIPGVALTTDVIAGFPGETEADFEDTMSLMEEVRFDSAFMFRYSIREGTKAAELEDDVPESVKIARLTSMIERQKSITQELNEELAGTVREVMVEGPSQRDPNLLFGRTRTAKSVVFEGGSDLAGSVVGVRVLSASAWTLHGELEEA